METSSTDYRKRRFLWARALVLVGICSWSAAPAFAAPILSISPSSAMVSLGSSFSLEIEIDDVTDLFGYQLELTFDPSILEASGAIEGPFLTSAGGISLFGGILAFLDNDLGTITILEALEGPVPPATGVTGSGLLAILNFIAIGPGSSAIDFESSILDDSIGVGITAQTQSGSVQVASVSDSPIPVPLTLILLGGLLFGYQKQRNGLSKAR